jgi:archaellum component FlaC
MVPCKPALNGTPFKRIYCTSCYTSHKAKQETIQEEEENVHDVQKTSLRPDSIVTQDNKIEQSNQTDIVDTHTVEELKKQLQHKEQLIKQMIRDIHNLTDHQQFLERSLYESNSRLCAIKGFVCLG